MQTSENNCDVKSGFVPPHIQRRNVVYREEKRETLPRVTANGEDYDTERYVLLADDTTGRRLLWVPGHQSQCGYGPDMRFYFPVSLQALWWDHERNCWRKHILAEGRRISKKLIVEHADVIAEHFGTTAGFVRLHVTPGQTIRITGENNGGNRSARRGKRK